MKKEEIHPDDIHRILFGDSPPFFLIEVLVRTIIVYIFLLFIIRRLGKRMSGQLTILEMAVMLTLGAIVSVGMQVPDRGIVLSMLVLFCTLTFQQGFAWLGFKNSKFEQLAVGKISLLVKDGVMQLAELKRCQVSRQQLFAQLRGGEIFQLGKAKRVYLEAYGFFSIFPELEDKAGLSVLPPDDERIKDKQQRMDLLACISCGLVKANVADNKTCNNCGHNDWTEAVK